MDDFRTLKPLNFKESFCHLLHNSLSWTLSLAYILQNFHYIPWNKQFKKTLNSTKTPIELNSILSMLKRKPLLRIQSRLLIQRPTKYSAFYLSSTRIGESPTQQTRKIPNNLKARESNYNKHTLFTQIIIEMLFLLFPMKPSSVYFFMSTNKLSTNLNAVHSV